MRTITGHSLDTAITREMLGASELAWLDRNRFGIIAGGAGDEKALAQRDHVAGSDGYSKSDSRPASGQMLRTRIGRLRGGSAVVYAAGSSESEMRYQRIR